MIRRSRRCFPVLVLAMLGHSALAFAGPELPEGVWVDITPPQVQKGAPETCLGQGIVVDPQNPSTVYWGTTPYTDALGGLFKTLDGGSNWSRVANTTPAYDGASDHLDMPLHVRIDPNDPNRLYAGDGVRGSSQGFFVSRDAGARFEKPPAWKQTLDAAGIATEDVYDVAVNPTNFDHALVSFHSAWGWTDTEWNQNAGIMETRDGGATFIVHRPAGEWGYGHSIKFLFDPEKEIGDAFTWLLGTQGAGYWRTDDAGVSWNKVSDTNITHGGSTIYYSKAGVLYTSGVTTTMRSMDNGETWQDVGPQGSWSVHGDGDFLYSGGGFEYNGPFMVSPEDDGVNWMPFSDQMFREGPYEMAYDQYYGIMYASNWTTGVFALKANRGSGALPPITTPDPIPPGGGSGGMSSGSGGGGGRANVAGSGNGGGTAGSTTATGGSGGTSQIARSSKAPENEGCGCRVTPSGSPSGAAFAVFSVLAFSVGRRLRRRAPA